MKHQSVSAQLKNYRKKRIHLGSFLFIYYIKKNSPHFCGYRYKDGAGDRSRTCMPKALDPKSSASANFATPAYKNRLVNKVAGPAGFEPTMKESKSFALPLGYGPISCLLFTALLIIHFLNSIFNYFFYFFTKAK